MVDIGVSISDKELECECPGLEEPEFECLSIFLSNSSRRELQTEDDSPCPSTVQNISLGTLQEDGALISDG
jgi:hypothetical protein